MKRFSCGLVILAVLAVALSTAHADAQQARDRMMARLAQLDQLRASGAVGENRDGLLEARDAQADASALIAEENADRREVYQAIAAQQGAAVDDVARARARQIAEKAAPGIWLQQADGSWYRK